MNDELADEDAQEVLSSHLSKPRHRRDPNQGPNLVSPDREQVKGYSKSDLCGDEVTVYLENPSDSDTVSLTFSGRGCAISQASASLVLDGLNGLHYHELRKAIHAIDEYFSACATRPELRTSREAVVSLPKKVRALAGVSLYPVRYGCSLVVVRALENLLKVR